MFSINCLEILENCDKSLRKNLIPGKFFFNDRYIEKEGKPVYNECSLMNKVPDFWGDKINIQAVVGKSGSGKSTLVDLMLAAINNFLYKYQKDSEFLQYVNGLAVHLYFSINKDLFALFCEDESVGIKKLVDKDFQDVRYADNELMLSELFGTMCINRSLFAFELSSYEQEYYDEMPFDTKKESWLENLLFWIKNNPLIAISPDRTLGMISSSENELYVLALLLYESKNNYDGISFLNGYEYEKTVCNLDLNFIETVFKDADIDINLDFEFRMDVVQKWLDLQMGQENSYLKICENALGLKKESETCLLYEILLFYLTEKMKKNVKECNAFLESVPSEDCEKFILKFIEKKDELYKTDVDVRRMINLLSYLRDVNDLESNLSFDFDKYQESIENDFESVLNSLPPLIFKHSLKLKKKSDDSVVDYSSLSSGEKSDVNAFADIISIALVMKENGKKNVNIMLDEIELSLHPELQRKFVYKLVSFLGSELLKDVSFCATLITHSPFILSDIPSSSVLFLEDGEPSEKKRMNSFAGNIGEMMYDSFFMEKTIGDFAEKKIKEIIRVKQGKNPYKKKDDGRTYCDLKELSYDEQENLKEECDIILKLIGDPVIRSLIEEVGV